MLDIADFLIEAVFGTNQIGPTGGLGLQEFGESFHLGLREPGFDEFESWKSAHTVFPISIFKIITQSLRVSERANLAQDQGIAVEMEAVGRHP